MKTVKESGVIILGQLNIGEYKIMKITITKFNSSGVDRSMKESNGDLLCDHCSEAILPSEDLYSFSIMKHGVLILEYSGGYYCTMQCVSTQIRDYERSN